MEYSFAPLFVIIIVALYNVKVQVLNCLCKNFVFIPLFQQLTPCFLCKTYTECTKSCAEGRSLVWYFSAFQILLFVFLRNTVAIFAILCKKMQAAKKPRLKNGAFGCVYAGLLRRGLRLSARQRAARQKRGLPLYRCIWFAPEANFVSPPGYSTRRIILPAVGGTA